MGALLRDLKRGNQLGERQLPAAVILRHSVKQRAILCKLALHLPVRKQGGDKIPVKAQFAFGFINLVIEPDLRRLGYPPHRFEQIAPGKEVILLKAQRAGKDDGHWDSRYVLPPRQLPHHAYCRHIAVVEALA